MNYGCIGIFTNSMRHEYKRALIKKLELVQPGDQVLVIETDDWGILVAETCNEMNLHYRILSLKEFVPTKRKNPKRQHIREYLEKRLIECSDRLIVNLPQRVGTKHLVSMAQRQGKVVLSL